jgi:arylsulfatase
VIATLGGRFGGYALMLSPSARWFLSSKPFKYIEYGLLIFGSLLLLVGTAGRWRKRFGYVLLLVAALGLILSFATDLFHIGRGRPIFVYNFLDLERFRWRGLSSLDEGKHTIVFDFKYAGPGPAKGGTGVLYVDGKEVDRKTIEHSTKPLTSGLILGRRWTLAMRCRSPSPERSTS